MLPEGICRRNAPLSARTLPRQERKTFPFLELPTELRIMVYKLIFNFDAVDKYFEFYTNLIVLSGLPKSTPPPGCCRTCPGIILVNREIYQESRDILYNTPIFLTHGILHANLHDVISANLLRNITNMTITDAGVDLTDSKLNITFHGVQHLLRQLSHILQDGHSLKKFKFLVKAEDFNWHLKNCTSSTVPCGIRHFVDGFKNTIATIRGIKCVIIEADMTEEFKATVIKQMTSEPKALFSLPLKVREKIYSYAADLDDGNKALENFMDKIDTADKLDYPTLTTPNVLLINRQIHEEALQVILNKPLIIRGVVPAQLNPDSFFKFFGRNIIQRVRYLALDLQEWRYVSLISDLAKALKEKNNLAEFHLRFEDDMEASSAYEDCCYPDQSLADLLYPLSTLRGIPRVSFSGSLPECFTFPLKESMMSPHGYPGFVLYAEYSDGGVAELTDPTDRKGSKENPIEIC